MKTAFAALILNASLCLCQDGPPVEIELMTYAEIHSAIHQQGKTTVIIYNGGTEQRGPHAVLGGHTFNARVTGAAIARKLGNALAAPVLPFSPAGSHLNPKWPGTAGISPGLYSSVNEAIVEDMVVNGFKNIVLIGDHGGGQKELETLAARLDRKHSGKGVRVYYSGAPYYKVRQDFDKWSKENHLPLSSHAGIPDTSVLMYLGGEKYVRRDKMVAGDPVLAPGEKRDPAKPLINNGIIGDPRLSSVEIGKRIFDMRVAYAVTEIQRLIQGKR
ncbi:MAG TPA: creatininase family protein [Bryobacteraceae bacterium]|nr:creatininase family protein [Bryobacteraceae bacterium]